MISVCLSSIFARNMSLGLKGHPCVSSSIFILSNQEGSFFRREPLCFGFGITPLASYRWVYWPAIYMRTVSPIQTFLAFPTQFPIFRIALKLLPLLGKILPWGNKAPCTPFKFAQDCFWNCFRKIKARPWSFHLG